MGFLALRQPNQLTSYWRAFGHSYLQYAFGTFDQTGRIDGQFSAALDIERGANWNNFAVNGAALAKDGYAQGGYVRVLQTVRPNVGRGGPYAPDGGATLLCFGINDLGFLGGGTTQVRTAFQHALRTVISRCRASTIFDDDFSVGTRTSYSAGFTSLGFANDQASGTTERISTTGTTGHTITMTLPADYNGEPVAMAFVGVNGATSGGTLTFSGTAGVTGTLVTTNVAPASTHTHMIKRVTNLTSANAGQTIIATVTAVGGGSASVEYDGWWLEAKNAPPVIVCNVARLTAAGYAIYGSWTGTEAAKDTDVQNLNTDIASVVAEFDGMVQIADIDSQINKSAALLFDGLHTNELGSAKCADAIIAAYKNLSPTTNLGNTANFNVPAPRSASLKKSRRSGFWYGPDYTSDASSTVLTAGNIYWQPFVVTAGRERYTRLGIRMAVTGTASSIRWGLYDDPGWTGYPQCLFSEATSAGALSTGTTVGLIASPTSGTGSIAWPLDPGLYWLCIKCTVAGTATFAIQNGPDRTGIMPILSGTDLTTQANIAYIQTGQGTTALPTFCPVGLSPNAIAPKIAMLLA